MNPERMLTAFLRIVGTVCSLAIIAVFMPRAWMAAIHEHLGLGLFPDGPIVEYLARSTSMFYAAMGGILWVLSRDVQRHRRAVAVLACAIIAGGWVLLTIDLRAGMPMAWTVCEGPFVILLGAATLILRARAQAGEAQAARP